MILNRRKFNSLLGGSLAAFHAEAIPRVRAMVGSTSQSAEESAANEDLWLYVREAFTIDRNVINLNSGSVSPPPRVVQGAERRYLEIQDMHPALYEEEILSPEADTVRRRLAATFGCDPEEIALLRNATEALENVQFGLDLKRGDEVLTTTQDYPSMLLTWQQRERRDGIVLKQLSFPVPPPSMDDLYDRVERAITPRTRVIHFCHVYYTTGQIFPVGRICRMARQRGIEAIVDGAHAFAQFPFKRDELDCDYYGTSLHKWLTAPIGTGFLYVRRAKIGKVWSLFGSDGSRQNDIRKFEEYGTFPAAHRNAVTEALVFYDSIGPERKAARLRYLRRRWATRLGAHPRVHILNADDPAQTCGIGAFRMDGIDSAKLTGWLREKKQIFVRTRVVKGEFSCVRVSPNVFTTLEEIDTFSEAIEQALSRGI